VPEASALFWFMWHLRTSQDTKHPALMKFQYNVAYVNDKTLNSEISRLVNSIWNGKNVCKVETFVSRSTGRKVKVLFIETFCCSI